MSTNRRIHTRLDGRIDGWVETSILLRGWSREICKLQSRLLNRKGQEQERRRRSSRARDGWRNWRKGADRTEGKWRVQDGEGEKERSCEVKRSKGGGEKWEEWRREAGDG